ncbi:MAG: sulfurtransferase [Mariniblastus sp.]
MKSEFVNIAAYKFVDLDRLAERKAELLPLCRSLDLKGTILLSLEGINMFVAGSRQSIDAFLKHITAQPEFADIPIKESISDHQPFSRMLVRLKKEIISMGVQAIKPLQKTSPKISAQQLKQWLDDGKDLTLLDVRNDYEVEVGTFANAVPVGIDHFRTFPEATKRLPSEMKQKPIVMFCTGGIRCEKAGPLMEEEGFREVYQLDGGILKYFEECGGEHYDGDCFVFDKRVAVDPDLKETEFEQCYGCQAVLSAEDQKSENYDPPRTCPNCYKTESEKRAELLEERNNLVAHLTTPLPGSVPYNNIRPMNVPLRFDGTKVIDFLLGMHAHVPREKWLASCEEGRITYKEKPLTAEDTVHAGWRVEHMVPQTTEPDVSNQVKFLYEDDVLIAVDKPAPLPMHPCGRFNRNTLNFFVNRVFSGEQIRILHRLDSNTTGVVVFARKKSAASFVHPQFVSGEVNKTYLARVLGHPANDEFTCDAPISNEASTAGSRTVDENGAAASTEFKVLDRFKDGTALIECYPRTGRTNQIRLHLSHLGFPICGDPIYNLQPNAGSDKDEQGKPVIKLQTLALGDRPMCLHAFKIELKHPISKEMFEICSERPIWCEASFPVA